MNTNIIFNKPYVTPQAIDMVKDVILSGKLKGNGVYTKKCHSFFENAYGCNKAFMTTSCTDALEMSAILCDINPGDEVIIPSYTFVSTATAFALRGAKIIFADSGPESPNVTPESIKKVVSSSTKVVVLVHYAGVSCDIDEIKSVLGGKDIKIVEDAAQGLASTYKGQALGTIGDFGTYSFHETKNITCGEGGLLLVNNVENIKRAEIVWEKGTNRSAFIRGEVEKYIWNDLGSSFMPSDILAALLYSQLLNIDEIQTKRITLWEQYDNALKDLDARGHFSTPKIPTYAENNGHTYYIVCNSADERTSLLNHLSSLGIQSVFHYICLHDSTYFKDKHSGDNLINAKRFEQCLLRLPLHYYLSEEDVEFVVKGVRSFYAR